MSPGSGDFLDSEDGEISLFRSVMRTRPVGLHRHVHILAIHTSIYRETGKKVPVEDIWVKLGRMYDLDALEHAVSLLSRCFSTTFSLVLLCIVWRVNHVRRGSDRYIYCRISTTCSLLRFTRNL